jgi:predicted dinucleotide-binding enzyme
MSPGMPLRTAIMGAGSIGAALAAHLILAGNNVTIGAPYALTASPRPTISGKASTIRSARSRKQSTGRK